MKIVMQRVKEASVTVDNEIVSKITNGALLLVGFTEGDQLKDIQYLADKVCNLRIFDDENGIMNRSLIDTNGSILSVSQFTLYANTKKGRRPNYELALNEKEAKELFDLFNLELTKSALNIKTGIFKAEMQVSLINDGPVTIILESRGSND